MWYGLIVLFSAFIAPLGAILLTKLFERVGMK